MVSQPRRNMKDRNASVLPTARRNGANGRSGRAICSNVPAVLLIISAGKSRRNPDRWKMVVWIDDIDQQVSAHGAEFFPLLSELRMMQLPVG